MEKIIFLVLLFVTSNKISCSGSKRCDYTFFLHSDSVICVDNDCKDKNLGQLSLEKGGRICLFDSDNKITTIELTDVFELYTYKHYYDTCILKTLDTLRYRCMNAGDCHWKTCTPNNMGDNGIFPQLRTNSTLYRRFGCKYQGNCKGYCGLESADRCAWISSELIHESCYSVYKLTRTDWALVVKKDSGREERVDLSSLNPSAQIPFIISVTGVQIYNDPLPYSSHILEIDSNRFYMVHASDRGFPIKGKIGDHQLSYVDGSETYNMDDLHCDSQSCVGYCTIPESPILSGKFLDPSKNKDVRVYPTTISMTKNLILRRSVFAHVNLITSTDGVKGVKVTTPSCDFDIIGSMGCYDCPSPGIISIQPKNVKALGVMEVKTNCTIYPKYLLCQNHPFVINVKGSPSHCTFEYYSKGNKSTVTLTSEISYEFADPLTPVRLSGSTSSIENIQETMDILMSNPNFLSGIYFTAGITVAATVFLRFISLVMTYYASKKVTNDQI